MKLSTTTAMYRYRRDGSYITLSDSAKGLYEAGYRDIDVNFCKADCEPLELTEDGWEDWARRYKEELDSLGMTADQSHAPFYRYRKAEDYRISEYREEMIRRSIVASGILGTKAITFHSIMADPKDAALNARANLEYFKPHLELAAKCGVSVAIENMFGKRLPDGRRGYRYHASLEELIELTDRLKQDFDNVGICWDTGHANEMGEDQGTCLRRIGKRLIATHINDNYGEKDDHLLPWLGTVDWEAVMNGLREIGYQGSFSFETHKFTAGMPDALLPEALRYTVSVGNALLGAAG